MNRHTFYIDSNNIIHAFSGEYISSKRKKIYAKRISRNSFSVLADKNNEYIFSFQEMIEYIVNTVEVSNEIIVINLSRANVGRILTLCNENMGIEQLEKKFIKKLM